MLILVFRRMTSSRWMVICLVLGSIMATALVSCIPIYTDGVLQRMLTKELENFQLDTGTFPGMYDVKSSNYYNYEPQDRTKAWKYFDQRIMGEYISEIGLPILSRSQDIRLGTLCFQAPGSDGKSMQKVYAALGALSGMEDHIKLTNGRMYSKDVKDGSYEVIVSQKAMKDLKLLMDKEYSLIDSTIKGKPVCRVKVVGVFTSSSPEDVYWHNNVDKYSKEFLMDFDLFESEFINTGSTLVSEAEWHCAFDYHKINLLNISAITDTCDKQDKWYQKYSGNLELLMPSMAIIEKYSERAAQLKTLLWVLMIPVLIMLTFYIFMVTQLIINHDENGIAVLKSRGASRKQIFLSYLLESLIIGVIAFFAGPPLGMVICRILGSSNGFLEFVQRTALPLKLDTWAFLYSLAAVFFLIATMLIPVITTSRLSVVNYKQGKSRGRKTPIWKKYFFDILILAVSAYGLYRYHQQQKILSATGIKASELQIDPLLFLASTFFVLGTGMLFLRMYPYFIRFIYWLGRKLWSPVMYVSLMQVGRSRGREQFLMLFIILAISTGIFNANSARTINRNVGDKIKYSTGADVTILAKWEDNQPGNYGGPLSESYGAAASVKQPIRYYEPDYQKFSTLSGTELATKVLVNDNGKAEDGEQSINGIKVMGIIPNEFAKIAWFRPDLLPYHWYNYLNLLADAPKAFLVSSNLKKKYNLHEGDTMYLSWGDQSFLEGMIYKFIDYWPTFNPNIIPGSYKEPGLVVCNLSYIQNKLAVQPYQVWIKKKPGATDKQMDDDIKKKNLYVTEIKYTNQQLIKAKNDPMLQGTNGSLTLGFITAMLISTLGFLIYWIISIQTRVLQFGILRAMGLSLARVIGMILCEQLLVSGAAIIAGIVIGGVTSNTFIPLLQIIYSSVDQVPPFKIIEYRGDYIKIYAVIAAMLLIGFLALWRLIVEIRIDQAVKLGED